jgi:hypothetical protein
MDPYPVGRDGDLGLSKHYVILWEGYFDEETNTVCREKFAKPSSSSN